MSQQEEMLARMATILEARLALDESLGVTHLSVAPEIIGLTPPAKRPHPKPQPHEPIAPIASAAPIVSSLPAAAPSKEQTAPEAGQLRSSGQTDTPKLPDSFAMAPAAPQNAMRPQSTQTAKSKSEIEQSEPQHLGSEQKLEAIKPLCQKALGCEECNLSHFRSQVVFGEGNLDADLMFIGQAPGREEDLQGRPFIGADGEMLTDIIQKGMKIKRADVYMTTIVKCRPQGNRKPEEQEVNTCLQYLDEQINIVKPKIIITVGLNAANFLTGQNLTVNQMIGVWQEYKDIPVMPILNTSYLLRQRRHLGRGNDYDKMTWMHIQQVMRRLDNA